MPRPSTQTHGPSAPLFPFLALFLCAAGALTTLVYGYEQRGQLKKAETAKALAQLQEADDLAVEQAGLNWRISQLQQARDKTQGQLADKQRELSHVEDHSRRLREQAERLRLSVEELGRQDGKQTQQSAAAEAELERIRRAIAAAQRVLLQQERAERDRPMTYSVVPYEGQNQTKRRPIYIECRKDAVVIRPEGLKFGEHDFDPPLGPGNPLAAAIRAYCEYLNRAGFTSETTRPYPLLLVRPDGIEAYYAARVALQSWGAEFGYELVGADWKLDFPPPDGRLSANLEQVVAHARLRQEALAVDAPRQYKRPRGGLRASSNGGFVADGDYEGSRHLGGNGFAARQVHGEGSGTNKRTGESGWRSSSGGNNSATVEEGSFGEVAARGTGVAGFDGHTRQRVGVGPGVAPSGPSPTQNAGSPSDPGTHKTSPGGNSSPTISDGPQLGAPVGKLGGTGGASRRALAGQSGGEEENKFGPLGSPGQGFQGDSQPAADTEGGSSRVSSEPGVPNSSAASGSASSDPASPGDPESSSIVTARVPSSQPKSLAKQRGRDWGLPDVSAQTTAVTRPVLIRCEPGQMTIMPDDNRALPRSIPLAARTEDSIDALVSGVWDHMKGWGLAGRGLYWRPTLVVEVAPGAESRFAELQTLLQDSGLDVKQRQRK